LAEARRAPLLVVGAVLVLAGAVAAAPAPRPVAAAGSALPSASVDAPEGALSSSWTCGGATAGTSSTLPGRLVVANAGATAVTGTVTLISSVRVSRSFPLSVGPGRARALDEAIPGAVLGAWAGAFVKLYGGMASVDQEVYSRWGEARVPCASATSGSWYFPYGMDLRNAGEYLSLLNPYPVDAIADLSFTTNSGREEPGDFEGLVVPARGVTEVGLEAHLRRREQIAATVHVRAGRLVAFETELVTKPPRLAQRVGARGAANPVAPRAGVVLALGAPSAQSSLWWPAGGEGGGVSETYDIYNPGPRPARATLSLVTSGTTGAGRVGGTDRVELPAYGFVKVTTNHQPWAISGAAYEVHLTSTNGVPLVAARSVTAEAPAARRGLGSMLGLAQPARQWAVAPSGAARLRVSNPGPVPAQVSVGTSGRGGRLTTWPGTPPLTVGPGAMGTVVLPASAEGRALVVRATVPVTVEQDYGPAPPESGVDISPGVLVSG
jgi:Family of unknown function (DUF5719)